MKHSSTLAALALLLPFGLATAALAQDPALPNIEDTDLSGDWSMIELQQVWPDLTVEGFASIDADGNGAVDAAELQNAVANGVVSAP